MGRYFQRNITTAHTYFPFTTKLSLRDVTDTAATVAGANVDAQGAIHTHVFTSASGEPGLATWSGNFAAQFDVTAIGSNITISQIDWRRFIVINSIDHASVRGMISTSPGWTGTGIRTTGNVPTSGSIESGATSDRLTVGVWANNSNMMSAESLTLRVNTTDSYVDVPWSVGEPPPGDTPRPPYIGGGYYG